MAAYIAIFLSSLCIILLVIILIKFKTLFSTDSIIEKTKKQMNKIIIDINKNTNMDIDLINEATKRTRLLLQESDDKMNEFKEASNILRDMIATIETQNFQSANKIPIYRNSLIDEIKPVGKMDSSNNKEKDDNIVFGNKNSIRANVYKKTQQQSLFDEDVEKEQSPTYGNFRADDNELLKSNDRVIPNIVTNIVAPANFVQKKSINDEIKDMLVLGKTVEDIAEELLIPVSEVQFIIDMLND